MTENESFASCTDVVAKAHDELDGELEGCHTPGEQVVIACQEYRAACIALPEYVAEHDTLQGAIEALVGWAETGRRAEGVLGFELESLKSIRARTEIGNNNLSLVKSLYRRIVEGGRDVD